MKYPQMHGFCGRCPDGHLPLRGRSRSREPGTASCVSLSLRSPGTQGERPADRSSACASGAAERRSRWAGPTPADSAGLGAEAEGAGGDVAAA